MNIKSALLLLFLTAFMQSSAQELGRKEMRLYERYRAFEQIDSLARFGVILYRLQTSSTSVTAMKAKNRDKLALKKLKEQREKNEALVRKFDTQFDFCPVYFFYSDQIQEVIEGDVYGNLLDGSLSRTDSLRPNLSYAFIGSFSQFETKYFPLRTAVTDWFNEEDMISPLTGYNLKNNKLKQYFSPPFPSYGMSISDLNNSLNAFYKKASKRHEKLLKHPKLKSALLKLGKDKSTKS